MREKILVVDDEEGIRYTFETFLVYEGYSVRTAKNYDEALYLITETEFDVIFADIILGDISGIEILREVRKRNIYCPVIIITGQPDIDTAVEAVRLGAFDYIAKPVQRKKLLHVAQLALHLKKVTDEREKYRLNIEAIFKSVKDAIITLDKELSVLEINESAKKICGVGRDSIGRNFHTIQTDCNLRCLESVRKTIDQKQSVESCRTECQRNNRSRQVVTISTSPLLNNNGVFSGAVMVVKDETRLNDLERNLEERRHFHNIIGQNDSMQKIYSLIEDLADVPTTVLITGESGTGKELVAEAIHYSGRRSEKPLIKVNCSALSENLLESELYGHVKGAFTGATQNKVGRFELANGGTIFLDEIGDISHRIQIKLLRVLQTNEIERVGDSTPIKTDVRIIAATNQNLRKKIGRGKFREDLYYRLKVIEIYLPPLRDRREDILLLVDHFIKKINKKLNKEITGISGDVMKLFVDYDWPGNIRELEHSLEHAFILCHQPVVAVDNLPKELRDSSRAKAFPYTQKGVDDSQVILRALEKTGWNKSKAARILGIHLRTLYRKIEKYNITEEDTPL